MDKSQHATISQAVVLGTGVNGLGVMRSLASVGIRSVGVHSGNGGENLGRYSRHCTAVAVPDTGDPLALEHEFLEALDAIAEGTDGLPFLIPTSDYFVLFMTKYRQRLRRRFQFSLASAEVVHLLTDKEAIGARASAGGLSVPRSYMPASSAELLASADDLPYPVILKPRNSVSVPFPGKTVVAADADELAVFVGNHADLIGDVLIQEIIPGPERNIFQCTAYVDGTGRPLQMFTMRKIHQYPPGYGVTTCGQSEENANIVRLTEALVAATGLTGFVSAEYKRHAGNGRYYFIEANPRLPWYNALFLAAGVNFPQVALSDISGSGVEPSAQSNGVTWLYFRNELAGWFEERRNDPERTIGQLLSHALRARAHAYWSTKDPLPFVAAVLDLFRWIVRRAGKWLKRALVR